LLTSIIVLLFDRNGESPSIAFAGFAFGIVWFAYMFAAPRFFSRRQFRNNPTARSPIVLDASEPGLEIRTAHSDSKMSWPAFVDWGESKSVFIILPQPRTYVPIPKRAFSDEQLSEFRELLRRNIVPKK
jgi:hypothetical protein